MNNQYDNWKNTGALKGIVNAQWSDEYKQFDWVETHVMSEVPKHDLWDNFATKARLELEDFHRQKGVVNEATKHYMSFSPALPETMQSILKNENASKYHYNFLKLTSCYCIPWHYDSYSTFVRSNDVVESNAKNIKRTIVMITPWMFGQVIQVGGQVITNWNVGDTYTWQGDVWHGAANFGFDDLVVMQITWL